MDAEHHDVIQPLLSYRALQVRFCPSHCTEWSLTGSVCSSGNQHQFSQAYDLRQQRLHARNNFCKYAQTADKVILPSFSVVDWKLIKKVRSCNLSRDLSKSSLQNWITSFNSSFYSSCFAAFSWTCSNNAYILKSSRSKRSLMQLITVSKSSK